MKKSLLTFACAILCACTLPISAHAEDKLTPQTLPTDRYGTLETKESFTLDARSSTSLSTDADWISVSGNLSSCNLTDTYTIQVPERANLILYSYKKASNTDLQVSLQTTTGVPVQSAVIPATGAAIQNNLMTDFVVEPGTYQLSYSTTPNATGSLNYQGRLVAYSASQEASVMLGDTVLGYQPKEEIVYRKVDVTRKGTLTVYGCYYNLNDYANFLLGKKKNIEDVATEGCYVTLCDANKNELVEATQTNDDNQFLQYYAVKKGTYYIKIMQPVQANTIYAIDTSFTANGTTINTSMSKALTLDKKYKHTLLYHGQKAQTRWCKIVLKKSRKLKVAYHYLGTNSGIRMVFCNKTGKVISTATKNISGGQSGTYFTKKSVPAGTYYIKILAPTKEIGHMAGKICLKLK